MSKMKAKLPAATFIADDTFCCRLPKKSGHGYFLGTWGVGGERAGSTGAIKGNKSIKGKKLSLNEIHI